MKSLKNVSDDNLRFNFPVCKTEYLYSDMLESQNDVASNSRVVAQKGATETKKSVSQCHNTICGVTQPKTTQCSGGQAKGCTLGSVDRPRRVQNVRGGCKNTSPSLPLLNFQRYTPLERLLSTPWKGPQGRNETSVVREPNTLQRQQQRYNDSRELTRKGGNSNLWRGLTGGSHGFSIVWPTSPTPAGNRQEGAHSRVPALGARA